MRGAKADASQSQPPQRPAATVAAVYQAHSPHNMTTLWWATTAEQLRAVRRSQGAGSRRQVEREDGGGRGGNACEHQESTRTTPTLYSTCTVAVHVLLHQACTYTPPTTHPGHGGSWRPCWGMDVRTLGGPAVSSVLCTRSPTCIAPVNEHCATYRHAIETLFFFAESQSHVRTGQRAARAAARGGWV